MEPVLSHLSALEYWRSVRVGSRSFRTVQDPRRFLAAPPRKGELADPGPWWLTRPLHVLVGSDAARRMSSEVVCHVESADLPVGSILDTRNGFCVCSPELCFVQMASELSLPALIRLGFELCGTYGVATVGKADFRFERPFTTPARLARFLDKAANMPGTVKARKALKHLVAGSASPMETTMAMLLCLPLRMGGYALPQPRMNHAVNPRGRSRLAVDDKCYYCDLIWPNANIALEYDGREHHGTVNKMADDATRRNNLLDRGVSVLTVTQNVETSSSSIISHAPCRGSSGSVRDATSKRGAPNSTSCTANCWGPPS